MADFERRVALVTGASGGIGGATARALAARGARLALAGRDEGRLRALAGALGAGARAFPCDLGAEGAPEALAREVLSALSTVDILVHAAGEHLHAALAESTAADFERLVGVNLRAPFLLTRALLPALRARRGEIVFVNSSVRAGCAVGLYAATKHALRALADSLRDEVNRDRVRVLSVYPGRTASAMQRRAAESEGTAYDPARLLQPEDVAEAIAAALALPRTAEVTDLHLRPA